jgi:hypothetical protein
MQMDEAFYPNGHHLLCPITRNGGCAGQPGPGSSAGQPLAADSVPLPVLGPDPSSLLAQVLSFYTAFSSNALTRLKDDNLTRTIPLDKPAFSPTTSR